MQRCRLCHMAHPNTPSGNRDWVRHAYERRDPLGQLAAEVAVLQALVYDRGGALA